MPHGNGRQFSIFVLIRISYEAIIMKDVPSRLRWLGTSFMIIDIALAQISTDPEAWQSDYLLKNNLLLVPGLRSTIFC